MSSSQFSREYVEQDYNALGQVTQIRRDTGPGVPYVNVANTDYTYDAVGQVRSIHDTDNLSSNLSHATYTFDAAHRLTGINRDGTLSTYTYDNSDQVTADGVNTVTYDASGNRNNGGNTATTGNRLSTDGVWNYSYDDEGNQTKKVNISSGLTWTYGYDQANHLTHVERRTTDGGTLELSADYKYDAWGNRVEKSVDADGAGAGAAVATRFAYDQWNPAKPSPIGTENSDVWADLDGSNSLTTRYVHGDVVDQLFARVSSGDVNRWYLVDHQGSVRNIVDNAGASKDALAYDAFGNIVSESNSAERGRYAWTSREIDTETGLQYNRARYYDSTTGRWISQDPMGFDAGDSNLYRYVRNKMIGQLDPSGMENRNIEIYYTEIANQQNRVYVSKGVRAKVDRIIQSALTTYGKGDTISLMWIDTPENKLDAMVKNDYERRDGKSFFGFVKSVSSSNLKFLWVPVPNTPSGTVGVGVYSVLCAGAAAPAYPFLVLGGIFGSVRDNLENGKTIRLSLQPVEKSTRGGLDTYGTGGNYGGVLYAHDVNFEIGKGNQAPVIPRVLFDDFVAMVISHEMFYHGLVKSGHFNDPGGPFVDDATFTPAVDGPKLGKMVFGPSAANGILKKLGLL